MKAVIFYFNGTLFFDTPLHIETWKKYIQKTLNQNLTDEQFMQRIWGRDNNAIIQDFYKTDDLDRIHWISNDKEREYRKLCLTKDISLVKGSIRFFEALKEKGIPFTIATGANKENVDFYFDVFELDKWFDYDQVIYDDGYLPGKPDPTIYKMTVENLKMKPEDCMVIEDSKVGVEAAHRAGIKEVYVITESTCDFESSVSGVIHDFDELMELLWKQND